jgi:hypothetical protein
MDPDPAIFAIDLQDTNKKNYYFSMFLFFLKVPAHLHNFSKVKSHKDVKKHMDPDPQHCLV